MRFTILFFILNFNNSFAQTFSLSNQLHFGTSGLNNCLKAEPTSDGGYLVLSSLTIANNDHQGTVYGNQDAWLIKLDANKQIEWEKVYGGSDDDLFSDFTILSTGNILVSGHSNSPISGNKTVGTNGFYDYWTLMLDSHGEILWQKNFGTDQNDYVSTNSILKINDNSFIDGGRTIAGINGDKTEPNIGGIDMWFVKIDSLGNLINDFSIGGDSDDYLTKNQMLSNGNFLILSSSSSGVSGDKNSVFIGGAADSWIIESDINGVIINQNYYGGTGSDGIGDFIEHDSGYILIGISDSPISGNKTSDKLGNMDGIILKMNSNLDISYEESYGGVGSWGFFRMINKLSNNEYIISGVSRGSTNLYRSIPTNGLNDIWLFGTDENLNYEWNYSFGGDNNDNISNLIPISDHEFDFFGHYESSSFSGDLTVPNYGSLSDILYMQINSDLFIQENTNSLSIFPNPTTNFISIEDNSLESLTYTISTINGTIILNGLYNEKIDVSGLSDGVYFIKIKNEKGYTISKFVKN